MALPVFSQAQDKGTAQPATKTTENKFAIENPETIHLDLVIASNSTGGTSIRADYGREIASALSDKEVAKQLMEMRTIQFPSVPDAMNYLSSIGFKYLDTYSVSDKDGKSETHILFEKRMLKRPATTTPKPEGNQKPADTAKPVDTTRPADTTKPKAPVREKK